MYRVSFSLSTCFLSCLQLSCQLKPKAKKMFKRRYGPVGGEHKIIGRDSHGHTPILCDQLKVCSTLSAALTMICNMAEKKMMWKSMGIDLSTMGHICKPWKWIHKHCARFHNPQAGFCKTCSLIHNPYVQILPSSH